MKKIQKFMCLILASATVFCVTACDGTQSSGDLPTSVDVGGMTETYGSWEGQTLEVVALDKGLGVAWLRDAVKTFNAATGSSIIIKPDETLNEALETYLSASSNSDVYFSYSSEAQWVRWAMQEKIVPLDDLGLTYKEDMEVVGVYESVRYTMPYSYSPTGFVYNQGYIDSIPSKGEFTQGTFPTTWQGLLDMCDSINNDWKKVTLGQQVVPMSWGATVGDMSYVFKALWGQIDPEGYKAYWNQETESVTGQNNKTLLVNDSTIQAMDCVAKLLDPTENSRGAYYPGNSFSDSIGHSNLIAQQKFLNGLSVFTISGSWFEQEMSEQIEDSEIDFYHYATMPIVNEGSEKTVYINTPAEYFMVTQNGKNNNKPLAKAFLRYLASEERLQVFHATTGVPAALEYRFKTDTLTRFAKEIAEAVESSNCVVSVSDRKASLSGAIGLNIATPFQQIATSAYTSTTAKTIIEDLYNKQYADWNDYFDTFK